MLLHLTICRPKRRKSRNKVRLTSYLNVKSCFTSGKILKFCVLDAKGNIPLNRQLKKCINSCVTGTKVVLEVIYTSKANKQHRKRDQICVYRGGGGEEELDEGGQKV